MAAARLIISGRVQGVWYRASTKQEAQRLNLTGWVRNMPDGRVEAIAQGPKETIEALISWCYDGPEFARVESVDVTWVEPEEGFDSFEVRYH